MQSYNREMSNKVTEPGLDTINKNIFTEATNLKTDNRLRALLMPLNKTNRSTDGENYLFLKATQRVLCVVVGEKKLGSLEHLRNLMSGNNSQQQH